MNTEIALMRIKELLARWHAEVAIGSKNGLFDGHRHAEMVARNLLNLIYDYKLESLDRVQNKPNVPGVDLACDACKIAVQVTSRHDKGKLLDALRAYEEKHKPLYHRGFRFFSISPFTVEPKLTAKEQEAYPNFNIQTDWLNLDSIYKMAEQFYHDGSPKFEALKQILEKEFSDAPQQKPSKYEKILMLAGATPPKHFMGREEDLKAIRQKFFEGENLVLLVNGEGGIGKTTIAAAYWKAYQHEYQHLAWVLAEESIGDALLRLAYPLAIDFEPKMPQEQRLQLLLAAMANLDDPCLLVIDNANNPNDLGKYFHALKKCPNFHFLLTTRINEFDEASTHKVAPLSEEMAFALFKAFYPKHQASENELLKEILDAVGWNTLVLELLGKSLHNFNRLRTNYDLQTLLEDLQSKGLLAVQSKTVETDYHAKNGLRQERPEDIITAMYDLSDLRDDEKQLLSVFAVLPAENISFERLDLLLQSPEELEDNLLLLYKKGWLDFDEATSAFKANPVVQAVVQKKNEKRLFGDVEGICDIIINKLRSKYNGRYLNEDDFIDAIWCANYAESLVKIRNREFDEKTAIMLQLLGDYHILVGRLDKALVHTKKFYSLISRLYQLNETDLGLKYGLVDANGAMGAVYSDLGKLDKSLKYFQIQLDLIKDIDDKTPFNYDNCKNLTIAYVNIASVYSRLGKIKEAYNFYQLDFNLTKELYAHDASRFKHDMVHSYLTMSQVVFELEQFKKALLFLNQAEILNIDLYKGNSNADAFKASLCQIYEKKSLVLMRLTRYKEALTFCQKNLRIAKELCITGPNIVESNYSLGICYQRMGFVLRFLKNLDKALWFFNEFSNLMLVSIDEYPQHVCFKSGLAASYFNIAQVMKEKGEISQASELLLKAKKIWEKLMEYAPEREYEQHLGQTNKLLSQLPSQT